MILKLVITVIFIAAALQKLTGRVAPSWERWGFSRQQMYAAGVAEVVALIVFWLPGLEPLGGAGLSVVLLGALATLMKNREAMSHTALPAVTLLLLIGQLYTSTVA